MSRIIPIPTTRVGDFFVRQRLSSQVQADQLAMFRLQNQIATGQRIQLPSEDAPAALRAINLQRLLDRKSQIQTNLQASNFYLASAESSLAQASQELVRLRGDVLSVSGTLATAEQRQAVIQQLDRTLQFMVDTGNTKAQGRYVFAGSRSAEAPYRFDGTNVEYLGNERTLRNFVDLERLFDTNLPGTEVFGGISTPVQGSVDLNPQTNDETLLSSINGGVGLGENAAITLRTVVGVNSPVTSVIDLSGAATLGDVARLIEAGAAASANVAVDVTGSGLVLRSTVASLTVTEVAQGTAAHELGIFTGTVSPGGTITGTSLDPALLKTTALSDLLGTKSRGRVVSANPNNDIVLSAAENGASFNNLTVQFVSGATAGNESASYVAGTNTLTVTIESGVTSASQVAAAINAEGTFDAADDYRDATNTTQAGSNTVDAATFTGVTSGGSGASLDRAAGLVLTNGPDSVTLDVSEAETVEDLLNLIRATGLGLEAEINTGATGINVRSRLSGTDLTIGENGGTTATQLGIRTYTGSTALDEFNRGIGVPTTSEFEQFDAAKMDELRIVARNGVEMVVNVSTATSLQDVVDLINAHPLNTANTVIDAQLFPNGNGIELVDGSDDGSGGISGQLRVRVVGGTQAAGYLGFVAAGSTQSTSQVQDTSGKDVLSGGEVLGNDLMIKAHNGTKLWIDLAGVESVQDVLNRINSHPDNSPTVVTARLASVGNGIELVDGSVGAGTLTVHALEGSLSAQYLGFVAEGATSSNAADVTVQGSNQLLTSEDRHTLETDSVFNTLLRLRTAIEDGNAPEIGRAIERLDVDLNRINFARAEMGTRLKNLEVVGVRLEDENVQLKSALSEDLDVDLVEAISNLTARQYAFEAALRSAGSLLQISLLDYL